MRKIMNTFLYIKNGLTNQWEITKQSVRKLGQRHELEFQKQELKWETNRERSPNSLFY